MIAGIFLSLANAGNLEPDAPKVGIIGHEFTAAWHMRRQVLLFARVRKCFLKWGSCADRRVVSRRLDDADVGRIFLQKTDADFSSSRCGSNELGLENAVLKDLKALSAELDRSEWCEWQHGVRSLAPSFCIDRLKTLRVCAGSRTLSKSSC